MKFRQLVVRMTARDLRAGEVRLLILAIALAVLAVGSVGMITDRAEQALAQQANQMLGGDAALRADLPIPPATLADAEQRGLKTSMSARFPSMARSEQGIQLVELRAVDAAFPLRGAFEIQAADAAPRMVQGGPKRGEVWLSPEATRALKVGIGDSVGIGDLQLRVSALLLKEPDAALDYFNVSPKAAMAWEDLPASGLVQPGSRIGYRLAVAGSGDAVAGFVNQMKSNLGRGQRIETVADARPEVRSALDRASRFLGLAALVSVVLAAIAIALAARRHVARHLDGTAVMRCLGASQSRLLLLFLGELLLIGLLATALGLAAAWLLQWGISGWLAQQWGVDLPSAGWRSWLSAASVGLLVLMAFASPPVIALRRVPALRVLRRDIPLTEPSAWVVLLVGLGGLAALLWWKAASPTLGGLMLAGIGLTFLALASFAAAMLWLAVRVRGRLRGVWRFGFANLSRRAGVSVAQVAALGLGLMALLLLVLMRTDLLAQWQRSLPADAPNRFIINVQQDQVPGVEAFFEQQGVKAPELTPMVRARMVAVNGQARSGEDYQGEYQGRGGMDRDRARRMAEREFNLSSAEALRKDNEVVAGKFWSADFRADEVQLSVEEEFAGTLGWKLGDVVRFDIAGAPLEGRVTSLRKVDWESFRPNFFVLVSPGALDAHSASYISAVHLPEGKEAVADEVVRAFPNLSVVNIDAVLAQVRDTVTQVSRVVESVFLFSLIAGVLVLLAAVQTAQDERLREGAVMRALGGSTRQLRWTRVIEFSVLGSIAGIVAAVAASTLAGSIADQVFDLPFTVNWPLVLGTTALGVAITLIAGLWATREVVKVSPTVVLRELG